MQSREEEQGERSEQPEYDHEEDAVEMSTEFEGSMEDVGEEEEQSDQSEGIDVTLLVLWFHFVY